MKISYIFNVINELNKSFWMNKFVCLVLHLNFEISIWWIKKIVIERGDDT